MFELCMRKSNYYILLHKMKPQSEKIAKYLNKFQETPSFCVCMCLNKSVHRMLDFSNGISDADVLKGEVNFQVIIMCIKYLCLDVPNVAS